MRILFVIDKLNMGGVTTSIINLLNEIQNDIQCDLLVFSGIDSINVELPQNINLVEPEKVLKILGTSQKEIWKESKLLAIIRLILVIISKIFSGYFSRKILFFFLKNKYEYDVAVSFTHDTGWNSLTTGCNQFVLERVNSKVSISFVHCDYANYEGYSPKQEKIYSKFDYIACVSESCKLRMASCFPSIKDKCIRVSNFTDIDKIKNMALSGYIYNKKVTNIVTVCRIAPEKGLDRALIAFKMLKDEGIDSFHYTIVGDGKDIDKVKRLVREYNLEPYVTFMGKSKNPYYYMKNADLFLLPSYHEAAPMIIGECKVLKLPIITTNTLSADELVGNQYAGIVCDNSVKGLYSALKNELLTKNLESNYNFDSSTVNDIPKIDLDNLINILQRDISKIDE